MRLGIEFGVPIKERPQTHTTQRLRIQTLSFLNGLCKYPTSTAASIQKCLENKNGEELKRNELCSCYGICLQGGVAYFWNITNVICLLSYFHPEFLFLLLRSEQLCSQNYIALEFIFFFFFKSI